MEADLIIKRFGPFDIVIILLLCLAAVAFFPAMRTSAPLTVVVRGENRLLARYPLDRDHSFSITGREGPLSVSIAKKGVAVVHSKCKNQICVRSGWITLPFQKIICAPNHVIVEIISSQEADSIDAILQ